MSNELLQCFHYDSQLQTELNWEIKGRIKYQMKYLLIRVSLKCQSVSHQILQDLRVKI